MSMSFLDHTFPVPTVCPAVSPYNTSRTVRHTTSRSLQRIKDSTVQLNLTSISLLEQSFFFFFFFTFAVYLFFLFFPEIPETDPPHYLNLSKGGDAVA